MGQSIPLYVYESVIEAKSSGDSHFNFSISNIISTIKNFIKNLKDKIRNLLKKIFSFKRREKENTNFGSHIEPGYIGKEIIEDRLVFESLEGNLYSSPDYNQDIENIKKYNDEIKNIEKEILFINKKDSDSQISLVRIIMNRLKNISDFITNISIKYQINSKDR